ncbi:MAG: class I SAM-dependent methyltransferase [Candidatus Hodarchaeales archaeon]|jgi:SAM-dependent methyltransferase
MDVFTLEFYNSNAAEITKRYENFDVEILHKDILNSFPRGIRLLELGCGSGRDAALLYSIGFDVYISDGSEEILNQAISIHPELKGRHFLITLPNKLPFLNESYDGIYAIALLMHLQQKDIIGVFLELNRILRKNGLFFFSVPLSREDVNKNGRDNQGRWFLLLPLEVWKKFIREANFKLVSIKESWDGSGRSVKWVSFLVKKQ